LTDDEVAGTFTFIRALEDYGTFPNPSAEDIGRAWLNYIIKDRTILWWGGYGNSTEHTAWLYLKKGITASTIGSIAANGKTVAEQIGAQILIDGWAMVAPCQPELSACLAGRAASAMTTKVSLPPTIGPPWNPKPSSRRKSTTFWISGLPRFRRAA
jgi:hypothetical protein